VETDSIPTLQEVEVEAEVEVKAVVKAQKP